MEAVKTILSTSDHCVMHTITLKPITSARSGLKVKVHINTCLYCGVRFEYHRKKTYCSIDCYPCKRKRLTLANRECLTCGIYYKPRYRKQKYCTKKCNPYKKPESPGFYQGKEWKEIRANYIASTTLINGINLSNRYCIECYKRHNRLNDMYAVDHKVRLKDGGSNDHSNLQSLCKHHHQSKSATEGNKQRYVTQNNIS